MSSSKELSTCLYTSRLSLDDDEDVDEQKHEEDDWIHDLEKLVQPSTQFVCPFALDEKSDSLIHPQSGTLFFHQLSLKKRLILEGTLTFSLLTFSSLITIKACNIVANTNDAVNPNQISIALSFDITITHINMLSNHNNMLKC